MIGNKDVIYGKLQKGERLDAAEIKTIERAFKECEKTHGIWKEYVSVYECSVCKHWEFKGDTLNIDFYKFCPVAVQKWTVKNNAFSGIYQDRRKESNGKI